MCWFSMKMFLLILFCLLSTSLGTSIGEETTTTSVCGEIGDCIVNENCDNKCGCDPYSAVLFYNETLDECVVNVKMLLLSLQERYNIEDKIRTQVDKVFQGILISVILFVTCASLCLCSACIYCIRINYMDNCMKNDMEALAAKLKRDCRFKKSMKSPTQQKEQSCNIIVEDAGLFVV